MNSKCQILDLGESQGSTCVVVDEGSAGGDGIMRALVALVRINTEVQSHLKQRKTSRVL